MKISFFFLLDKYQNLLVRADGTIGVMIPAKIMSIVYQRPIL
mgnify:FL=1